MTEYLSRILSPFGISSFLSHFQRRRHFHIGRNCPGYYDDFLKVGDVDGFLQSERLPAVFFNVVKEGTRYSLEEWSRMETSVRGACLVAVPERLFALYSEGATLVLNQADRSFPSLSTLCRTLSAELGFPVHANVYVTPDRSSGFARHADNHEVLVIQIAGSKRWQLYIDDNTVEEIDLACGDLLYLPRGLAHSAKAQDGDSIHVTLGLTPVYGFQLVQELAATALRTSGFQQPMPPRCAENDARQEFEAEFLEQLRNLLAQTQPSALIDAASQSLLESQSQGWPGRLSDLRLHNDITAKTIVRRRPGIIVSVRNEGKFLCVAFSDKRVIVAAFLGDALSLILGEREFATSELKGFIAEAGKVKLVAEFVRAGLLQIVHI